MPRAKPRVVAPSQDLSCLDEVVLRHRQERDAGAFLDPHHPRPGPGERGNRARDPGRDQNDVAPTWDRYCGIAGIAVLSLSGVGTVRSESE